MATRAAPPRHRRDLVTPVVASTAAALVLATVAASHPHQSFDRVRKLDRTEVMLPDWRFFAPNPAQHDYHVLFRLSWAQEEPTPWDEVQAITPRRWVHGVWFPGRRRSKALFDHVMQLLRLAQGFETRFLPRTVPYRMLRGLVAERVRTTMHPGRDLPDRFQFAVVKYSGVDDSEEPEFVLVSPWEQAPEPDDRPRPS